MLRYALCLALIFATPATFAEDLFDGAPEAPPGYDDYRKAQAALAMGKVEMVDDKPAIPDTVQFYDNIEYGSPDGVSLTLDLYVPKNAKTPPPVLLYIHGGGWRGGKKEDVARYTVPFSAAGYACATIQYRLLPEHTFPKAIQDVNSAIHWIRTNSEKYGFNGKRITTLGGSAGGHLAMLAAYAQDPALGAPENPEGVKQRLEAVVNIYGVVDCTTPIAQQAKQVQDFIGAPYAESVDIHALASPLFHLDPEDPPTLTMHGTIDELVPISQADRLHEHLDTLGVTNYYDRVEGWPHSMDVALPIQDRAIYITKKFLDKHFPIEK